MKNVFYLFLCALMVASPAFAAFVEESESFMTVQNVKDLKDESPVRLKGKITKNLGDDKYSFSDNTGVIIIEIDEEDWNGKDVTASDIIIIDGEVDKGFLSSEIDVNTIELVK